MLATRIYSAWQSNLESKNLRLFSCFIHSNIKSSSTFDFFHIMASMKLQEQLEEQPKDDKPIIGNCKEEGGNASDPNESELPKSVKGDKESELPPKDLQTFYLSRPLPLELNCEIFKCLKLPIQRKFIAGLGRGIYKMSRQKVLKKTKRLCNPKNRWETNNRDVKISEDGLNASNIDKQLGVIIYAIDGFPISGEDCREDNFPGTICYYYEVKILKSFCWYEIGLTDGEIPSGGWIGQSPNSYAIAISIPNLNFYHFFFAGRNHLFEFPEGVIRPEVKETGNVVGCGILMNPDDKLTVFFTQNGILIDRQFPIDPTVDRLFPTVTLWDDMSLEANFGDNPAKPFEYDIKNCSGMGLEWI